MDRVFSVDEFSDQFWSPPIPSGKGESSKMNRSASEWAFQRFLQEVSVASETSQPSPSSDPDKNDDLIVEIKEQPNPKQDPTTPPAPKNGTVLPNGPAPNILVDSEQYQAILKSKLNLACAAVALTRVALFVTRSALEICIAEKTDGLIGSLLVVDISAFNFFFKICLWLLRKIQNSWEMKGRIIVWTL